MLTYRVARLPAAPADFSDWQGAGWVELPTLEAAAFRPESSPHRPQTQARFAVAGGAFCGLFRVQDRFVRCVHTRFQDPTHLDSCVEVFLQPKAGLGYFNFEFNCGGALAVFYITDPARIPGGFRAFQHLTPQDVQALAVYPSLPPLVEPEIQAPVQWTLGFAFPVALFEPYIGPLGELSGQTWRANVFKCADDSSHPHWAAWSPATELNFHRPQDFGAFQFD